MFSCENRKSASCFFFNSTAEHWISDYFTKSIWRSQYILTFKGNTTMKQQKILSVADVNYAPAIKGWPVQNLMYFTVSFCFDQHIQRRKIKVFDSENIWNGAAANKNPLISVICFPSSIRIPQYVITGKTWNSDQSLCLSFKFFDGHAFIHLPALTRYGVFASCWWGNMTFLRR